MSTTLDNLIAARAVIADEANWIKHSMYQQVDDRDCFCSLGAIGKATDYLYVVDGDSGTRWYDYHTYTLDLGITAQYQAYLDAIAAMAAAVPDVDPFTKGDIAGFNDRYDTTHADVLAAFDRAIALQTLKEAREIVANPDTWTTGQLHDVKDGRDCYCALGAIGTVSGIPMSKPARPVEVYDVLAELGAVQELAIACKRLNVFLADAPDISSVYAINDRLDDDCNVDNEPILAAFDAAITNLTTPS